MRAITKIEEKASVSRLRLLIWAVFGLLVHTTSRAQLTLSSGVVNRYAQVTAINFGSKTVTLGTQSGATHTWAVGDHVLLVQMTGNTSANGGKFEFTTIEAVSGTTFTLSKLTRSYTPASEKVQLVWVPYDVTSITVPAGGISAQKWDGTTGGIVSILTPGTITLNGNVNANGAGFRYADGTNTINGSDIYYGGGGGTDFGGPGGGGGGYGSAGKKGTVSGGSFPFINATDGTLNGGFGGLNSDYKTSGGGGGGAGVGGAGSGGSAAAHGGGGGGGAGYAGGGPGGAGGDNGGAGGSGSVGSSGDTNGGPGNVGSGAEKGGGGGGGNRFIGGGGGAGVNSATGGGRSGTNGGTGGTGTYSYSGDAIGGKGGGSIPSAFNQYQYCDASFNCPDPRIWMAGGGQNNTQGGGIVMMSANTIVANNKIVSADGDPGSILYPSDAATGGGGGGGGGLLVVNAHLVTNGPIQLCAKGGKGATGLTDGYHGGGGGGSGGGGLVWVQDPAGGIGNNSTGAPPIVPNITFCVDGGVVATAVLNPKTAAYTGVGGAGGGGAIAANNPCGLFGPGSCICSLTASPALTSIQKTNICPATTVDLRSVTATNAPVSGTVTLQWFSSATASAASQITNVSGVSAGTYYAAFYDMAANCYSPTTAVTAVVTECCAATVAPTLSTNSKTNVCPANTVDLSYIVATNQPVSLTLAWFSSATASAASQITNVSGVSAGTYYAAFYDGAANCYSPTTTVMASLTPCCANPSVGGIASFSAGVLCDASNAGTILLAGYSGIISKWQTSTDNGNSWQDIAGSGGKASYSFINATNGQRFRAVVNGGLACSDAYSSTISISTSSTVCTSVSCDKLAGSLTFNLTTASSTSITNAIILTDATGSIRYVSATNSNTVAGVIAGDYIAYLVSYDNTQSPAPILSVGTNLQSIGGACVAYSAQLPVKVCALSPPVARPDIANTNLNTPVSGNVLTNDTDPQGLPLTASLLSQPVNGTVTLSPNGSYTYTPPTGFTGTTSFCYSVSNSAGLSSSACVTVNVLPLPDGLKNNPPVANNDATKTTTGKPVTVAVLANDTDPDSATSLNGQLANPTLLGQPATGTAVVNSDGTVTYTPPSGFTGVVSFPYSVCDKGTPALCVTAVVTVNVQPEPPAGTTVVGPVAMDDAILTNINTPKAATVAGNDRDGNTPALSLSYAGGQPSHGSVVMSANGSYTYTPATGYVGPDSFTYTVCNTAGLCDKATVSVLIQNPVIPQPPVATPDIANTNLNTPVPGNVLTNDTDPQGLPLTASLLSQPLNGTVTLSPNGSYTYTPPTGFTGTTSFCYSVSNSAGLSSSACVTVNVLPLPDGLKNNPPVANNDATKTTSGKPVLVAVLANDTDPDNATSLNGQLANPTLLGQPTTGTAVVNGDGTVTYTPPTGFTGVVSFPYSVCDKGTPALCATAVVTVNVQPEPPAGTTVVGPVAMDDAILTNINTPKAATVAGNDRDGNTPALSLSYAGGQPSHGSVVLSANGSYTYTPATGYIGPDSFTYTVCNTAGLCDKATVSVLVQNPVTPQPPVATPDIANTNLNTPVSGNVLTNDTDPQGLPLTASLLSQPVNGTVTLSPNGSYTYTPPTGFTGTTSFCYSVSNSAGLSSSACVTVNVLPLPDGLKNNPPVANNDATKTTSGKPVLVAVLANDTDPDNATSLNGQLANPTLLGQPTTGTAVVNGDGTVTYTPPTGFTGVVSFPYSVCDKGTPALCATAVVTVNVQPEPPAGTTVVGPVAMDDAILTNINTPKAATVAGNDRDGNTPALSLSYAGGQPSHGSVVMSANGSYTYTPATGYVGPDSFTYTVCNTAGLCDKATVSVLIQNPVIPQPPVATPDIANTNLNTPVPGNVLTNDTDPQGLPLTASLLSQPVNGTVTLSPNGSYTYTPPTGFTGTTSFCYSVSNSAGLSSSACVTVNVLPLPDGLKNNPPVANNDATKTTSGKPVLVAVLANDTDPDNATSLNGQLAYPALLGQPATGTAVVNGDGTVTYTPPTGFTGVVSFPYSVCDKGTPALCATAVVTVNVQPDPPAGTTVVSPVAMDDAILTNINTPKAATVAGNDRDGNTPALSLSYAGGQPSHGSVVMSANGSYTYTPATGYVGPDSFTYTVCNTAGLCDKATVSVLVLNPVTPQPPVARPDIANTNLNTPVPGNVLTNDTDPQGLPLTASLLSQPVNGTVTLSPNGSYTYTPPTGFTGTTSFCYSVSNSAGLSSSACVTVNVLPLPDGLKNNPPVANNDATKTTSGKPVLVAVLANDTDPDNATSLNGQLANPALLGQPTTGTAVVNGDGTVTYTPPSGFTGVVSFPYSVCDKGTPALCATALVTVNVQPEPPAGTTVVGPVAIDDAILTNINTPKTATVAGNDRDGNTPALSLSYAGGQPSHGSVVLSANGSYTYTPATGYVGPDSFTYTVCNTAGLCDKATVSVLVQNPVTPQPPVARPDIANTNLNTPVPGNVLTNDTDPQGLPLTASLLSQPVNGTVTLSPNGSYTYTPPTGFTGTTSFCYSVSNSAGLSSSACVTVNVLPLPDGLKNNPPVANNDATKTTTGKPVLVAVLANDTDPDNATSLNGQLANPTLLGQPATGTAVVNSDGTVTYTPPTGFTGVVSFPYSVCDKGTPVLCATAVVTVNVQSDPPAGTTVVGPVAMDDAILTNINTPKAATVAGNDRDGNTPALSLSYAGGQPSHGSVVLSANGSYTYTPATGYVGPDSFTYTVCNTAGLCDKATVSVLIQNPAGLKLLPKAWLQGALFNVTDVNGVMRDDLRTKNLIPATSPYGSFSAITTASVISNTATVFGVTGNDAIVDWVFVELRSPANMSLVVDSRAALIQRDGDIVDLDGTSAVQFGQATPGNYYVSVRHRNHLGVMTATAIPLAVTGTVVDFRTPATPTYRVSTAAINQAQVTVAQGVALWAGNVLYDKTVIYQGTGNDVSAISVQVKGVTKPDGSLFNITGSAFYILNGYYTGDVNMDGRTIYQGTGNDVNYIYLNVTRNHPGNIAGQNIFIIREQLP